MAGTKVRGTSNGQLQESFRPPEGIQILKCNEKSLKTVRKGMPKPDILTNMALTAIGNLKGARMKKGGQIRRLL